jgi:hypothetical protein
MVFTDWGQHHPWGPNFAPGVEIKNWPQAFPMSHPGGPQGGISPLGVNLAPRGEICPLRVKFTPSFTPRRMERQTENFTPRGQIHPWGTTLSLYGGQSLPLEVKLRMGLCLHEQ